MPERTLAVDELDAVAWHENPRLRHAVVFVDVEPPFRNRERGRHFRPLDHGSDIIPLTRSAAGLSEY